jgi:hypothetical protein
MFRTHETRLGPGALFAPGDDGADTAMGLSLTVACRLSTAGPCHPGVTTRPGMSSITQDRLHGEVFSVRENPFPCSPPPNHAGAFRRT